MTTGPVLIAEDEENDVFFLRRALQKAGVQHPVLFVSDGQGVINYLQGTGEYRDRVKYPLPVLLVRALRPFPAALAAVRDALRGLVSGIEMPGEVWPEIAT